jgi:hypothetical protein
MKPVTVIHISYPVLKLSAFLFRTHDWTGPYGSESLRLPEFLDKRYMKVTRLSVLQTGHLYPKYKFLVLIFLKRLGKTPRATVRPEELSQ